MGISVPHSAWSVEQQEIGVWLIGNDDDLVNRKLIF